MSAFNSELSSKSPRLPNDAAPETLRFGERAGLLAGISSDVSFENMAMDELRRRIAFIESTRGLGFEVHQLRDLLAISDTARANNPPSEATITAQVEVIDQKIIALMRLRKGLLQMQDCSDNYLRPGRCPVPSVLHGDTGD